MRLIALSLCLAACTGGPAADAPAPPAAPETAEAAPPAAAPTAEGWESYGDAFADGEVVPLSAALASADTLEGQTVLVEGRVSEVCQKAGCWMVISEEEQHVRVRMKDHSFSVDKNGAGRVGQVQGTLVAKAIDPAEVAHFASETRAGGIVPEQAAKIGRTWEIEATSVRMRALN